MGRRAEGGSVPRALHRGSAGRGPWRTLSGHPARPAHQVVRLGEKTRHRCSPRALSHAQRPSCEPAPGAQWRSVGSLAGGATESQHKGPPRRRIVLRPRRPRPRARWRQPRAENRSGRSPRVERDTHRGDREPFLSGAATAARGRVESRTKAAGGTGGPEVGRPRLEVGAEGLPALAADPDGRREEGPPGRAGEGRREEPAAAGGRRRRDRAEDHGEDLRERGACFQFYIHHPYKSYISSA